MTKRVTKSTTPN